MPRKLTTGQPAFTMLVPTHAGGSDPSRGATGNPSVVRTTFRQQHLPEVPGSTGWGPNTVPEETPGLRTKTGLLTTTAGVPVGASGTITVDSNDFAFPATLHVGEYTLISGDGFTVGGNVNATAQNVAGAIGRLHGFDAVAAFAVVTITGPAGPDGNDLLFEAIYDGDVENFTLAPAVGTFESAEPTIGPPTIT
jgi:hypothetical protein